MMDPHTRERLGRLCRWMLLAGGALAATAAPLIVVLALPGTVDTADGWIVHGDELARDRSMIRLPVRLPPGRGGEASYFYWLDGGGRVLMPGHRGPPGTNDEGYHFLGARGLPSGEPVVLRPLASPYSGFFPAEQAVSTMYVVPPGPTVVLLDVRAVASTDAAGRLADSAEEDWPRTAGALIELAGAAPLAYLTTAPLDQYERVRRLMRRAPAGPVIPAADRWDSPASVARAAQAAGHAGQWAGPVLLVTPDVELARQPLPGSVTVALLGRHSDPPPRVVVVPNLLALREFLSR